MTFRIEAPTVERVVRSADGTELACFAFGHGPRAWVMPPAMGAPILSMKYIVEHFARDFTVYTWDMRGFYRSGVPAHADALRVEDHVRDLEAVIEAFGLARFVLGGWSMAVPISLEYQHRARERVEALVLVNGPYGRALAGVVPVRGGERLVARALRLGSRAGPLMRVVSSRMLKAKGMGRALEKVGLLARNPEFFEAILAEFGTIDVGRYMRMIALLDAYDGEPLLSHVTAPTLITAGTHDRLTPEESAQKLHAAIRGSRLEVFEGATHYIVAEFPDELNAAIRRFLDEI